MIRASGESLLKDKFFKVNGRGIDLNAWIDMTSFEMSSLSFIVYSLKFVVHTTLPCSCYTSHSIILSSSTVDQINDIIVFIYL